jgi:hypothetical protein
MSMRTGVAFQHALHCSRDLKILGTGHIGTIRSLDDFRVHPGTPIGRRALALASRTRDPKASNMAKLNPGSVAAIVLAGIVVLVLGAGSYVISSRLNRDAATAGNSASAPNAPGRINEQPMKDRTTPRQTEPPLVETNVPPAGR